MNIIGQLATLKQEEFTPEGIPTGIRAQSNTFNMCKHISLDYPVSESLEFSEDVLSANSVCLVISEHGRPTSFSKSSIWNTYDIVTVLVDGKFYKCFRQSLNFFALQDIH